MRRVLSMFADRLPSYGLLLLRVVVATALIARCLQQERSGASLHTLAPHVFAAAAGLFVLFGLWSSVAGMILAISESLIAFSHAHDPWVSVLLVSFGIALALLGPGSWSVDARRSGWRRIEILPPDK